MSPATPDVDMLTESQAQRRQRVIEAAMALASEGGYDAVQMRDVATSADVALGTIYRYFSSKDHLLTAAWAEWAERLVDRMATRPAASVPVAEQVADAMRRGTKAFERDPNLAAALITSITAMSPDRRRRTGHEMEGTLERMLARPLAELDADRRRAVILVIGRVWIASLIMWVTGRLAIDHVYADLDTTAHLLLHDA